MADEPEPTVDQLHAALRELQARHSETLAENAALREREAASTEILQAIASSASDLQTILDTICSSAMRLTGSTQMGVALLEGDYLRHVARVGYTLHEVGELLNVNLHRPGTVATRESRTVHIPDRSSAEFLNEYPTAPPVSASALHVPLIRADQAIGVITVMRIPANPYDERDVSLLEAFADQAVIAIENARLFQELEDRTSALTRALEQQTAMAEVLRVIASSPADLQSVLDAITETARRLCGTQGVRIQRPIGDRFGTTSQAGLDRRTNRPGPLDRHSVPGRAYLDRATVHVPDIEAAADELRSSAWRAREFGWRAIVSTPLLHGDDVYGALTLYNLDPGPYTDDQIRLLETFASQAAIAIANSTLFEELQEANSQLAEASRHKSQFLANMSHELRTPLNAIFGYSEIRQEEAEDMDADAFLPDLRRINGAGKHLLGLINDILDLSKIDADRIALFLETFKIRSLVGRQW